MRHHSLILFCVLLLSSIAFANQDPSRDAAAQISQARQLFEEQKFSEAAQALQEAYRLAPNPLYLFNAGQSYRKAEDKPRALDLYREFLRIAPEHKLAEEARGYVRDLESAIAMQSSLSTVKLELEAERAESDEAQRKAKDAQQRAEQAQRALEIERKKPFYKRGWFYGVVIGGTLGIAAIIAAGVGIGITSDPRRAADARDLSITF